MNILIAIASRHGSTREIADAIAHDLRTRGHATMVQNADDVRTVEGYDAVIAGSAIYMGNWLPEARRGVDRNRERLAAIPGVSLVNDSFFNEFTLKLPVEARPAVHALVERRVLGGVSLGRLYPGVEALRNGLVVAVTETESDEDISGLEAGLKEVVQ